jgi:hypothetical protein
MLQVWKLKETAALITPREGRGHIQCHDATAIRQALTVGEAKLARRLGVARSSIHRLGAV